MKEALALLRSKLGVQWSTTFMASVASMATWNVQVAEGIESVKVQIPPPPLFSPAGLSTEASFPYKFFSPAFSLP